MGLAHNHTLEALFTKAGYKVTNAARPGKSNTAIALDTFNNSSAHDVYVLGFTFSSRHYLKFNNVDIDLINTRYEMNAVDDADIEQAYVDIHKSFYTLFDSRHWNNMSDMLVDNTLSGLKFRSKKVFAFSWENRQTTNEVYYPIVLPGERLPDGHLNVVGTQKIFNKIQNSLGDA